MTVTAADHRQKFIGFALHDALADAGIKPYSDRYCSHVSIWATVREACTVRFLFPWNDDGDRTLYAEETYKVKWQDLRAGLQGLGLLDDENYIRSIRIQAPRDEPCTIVIERYADSRLLDAIRDGAATRAESPDEALAT